MYVFQALKWSPAYVKSYVQKNSFVEFLRTYEHKYISQEVKSFKSIQEANKEL